MENTPRHVAIIMDGNGRWAAAGGKDRLDGHRIGVMALRRTVLAAADSEVEYLTVYAFSTENWGRPEAEVYGIMELLSQTLVDQATDLAKNGVRLSFIGDICGLSLELQNNITTACGVYVDKVKLNLVVALNYSARQDIVRSVQRIVSEGVHDVSEDTIKQHLSTAGMPDVDLLIRTSGEQRLSNFLLWELSYAELYFTETLWPDFSAEQFMLALQWFDSRSRRYGKL